MAGKYYVIFRGEIAPDFIKDEVKKELAELLEEDSDTIDDLFSGRIHVLKSDHNLEQCQGLQDIFLTAGAVCHIRDSDGHNVEKLVRATSSQHSSHEEIAAANSLPILNQISVKCLPPLKHARDKLSERYEVLHYHTKELYREGSESISTDWETGGWSHLVKNRFFLFISTGVFVLFFALAFTLSFEKKTMPINDHNLTTIIKHIEFIEKAFTIDELRNMSENPKEFLDYLLADPIKKMGYNFNATIEDIAERFLSNDLKAKELKMINNYLEISVLERDKLLTYGFIDDELKELLDKVAKKTSQ